MKSEPQSSVLSPSRSASVSALSRAGAVRSFGVHPLVVATWTLTSAGSYALASRFNASQEASSPLPSRRAMVSASRPTELTVSPRNCEVSVNATGTVNNAIATATRTT